MRFLLAFFLFIFGATCDDDIWREFEDAQSPMQSQFHLGIIQMNFPGLYDDVFAGIESRIAGGQTATENQFPWQVLMYMKDSNSNTFICGGGLLAYNWILTAAHCVYRFDSISVHIGTLNRLQIRSVMSQNITNHQDLITHPHYNPTGHLHDIALVYLRDTKPSLMDNPRVAAISLPNAEEVKVTLIGMQATVCGFGSTSDTNKASEYLRFITMPIIGNSQCQRVFGQFIKPSHVCMSGSEGRSVCSGDSGGSLVVEINPGRKVVVGVVSFGHKHGCTLGHPAVFTRVTNYLNWIESHISGAAKDSMLETEENDILDSDGNENLKFSKILLIFTIFFCIFR